MHPKPNRAAIILGIALLLGPSLTACNLIGSSTCQTLTGGGRGGSSGGSKTGKSSTTKTKPKTGTVPKSRTGHHSDDDCDDD